MTAHASRGHAKWSASASERRWGCPGSLAMEARFPEDRESFAAAWGTAAHEVAEAMLLGLGVPKVVKTKSHTIEVDDEIEECAQVFVDYVREQVGNSRTMFSEQTFGLDAIDPPIEGGGTADAVILDREAGVIEVVDLKGGMGVVVEVIGNKQLRTYALGALLANPGPWKRVKVTIVQPRAPHPDGRIRSEEFHVADLMDWTADLLEAMHAAVRAGERPEDHLSAGDHCRFCKAQHVCPKVAETALAEAHTFFEPEGVRAPPAPETLGMERIVRILDHADMIENWLKAVRAYAHEQAELGTDVTDGHSTYVLVPKRAMRKWDDCADAEALALATGRDEAEFFAEPKMLSPAQVEKLVGKKAFAAVEGLVTKESSGTNLVRSDKTTRPAVLPPVKQFFQPE